MFSVITRQIRCDSITLYDQRTKGISMNLEACTQAIRAKVGADSGLNATLKFDCGADGVIRHRRHVYTPNTVTNDNIDSDCTVGITLDNLNALLSGDLEPTTGFMAGKLKCQRRHGRGHAPATRHLMTMKLQRTTRGPLSTRTATRPPPNSSASPSCAASSASRCARCGFMKTRACWRRGASMAHASTPGATGPASP